MKPTREDAGGATDTPWRNVTFLVEGQLLAQKEVFWGEYRTGKYYAESAAFQQAILDCIAQAHTKDKAELASLLRLRFQTFKAVPIVGDQPQVVMFLVAKRKRTTAQKISAKAA